jgi:hypothetical protein
MKKHFRKLDAIAAALLVGTVGAMAIGQVLPPFVFCPGGTVVVDGVAHGFGPIMCPAGSECGVTVTIGMGGGVTVTPICIAPTPPTPVPQ